MKKFIITLLYAAIAFSACSHGESKSFDEFSYALGYNVGAGLKSPDFKLLKSDSDIREFERGLDYGLKLDDIDCTTMPESPFEMGKTIAAMAKISTQRDPQLSEVEVDSYIEGIKAALGLVPAKMTAEQAEKIQMERFNELNQQYYARNAGKKFELKGANDGETLQVTLGEPYEVNWRYEVLPLAESSAEFNQKIRDVLSSASYKGEVRMGSSPEIELENLSQQTIGSIKDAMKKVALPEGYCWISRMRKNGVFIFGIFDKNKGLSTQITETKIDLDENDRPVIVHSFDRPFADEMEKFTENNIGRDIALIVNDTPESIFMIFSVIGSDPTWLAVDEEKMYDLFQDARLKN